MTLKKNQIGTKKRDKNNNLQSNDTKLSKKSKKRSRKNKTESYSHHHETENKSKKISGNWNHIME